MGILETAAQLSLPGLISPLCSLENIHVGQKAMLYQYSWLWDEEKRRIYGGEKKRQQDKGSKPFSPGYSSRA